VLLSEVQKNEYKIFVISILMFVCSCTGKQGLYCQEFYNVPSNIFALSSKIDEKFDGKNATFFQFL